MAIRITRNEEGNCITFIGSSNPAYWNSCLSAELSDDSGRFHIINDIRSANEAEIQYEFFNVLYTDFADRDGNVFESAQTAVDYINANANVIGLDGGTDMTGEDINFRLDQTSTTILSTTGSQWGVNSVKAVVESNGLISIHSIGEGVPTGAEDVNEKKHYRNLEHERVSVNGTLIAGGAQDVANTLNELFTVGAFETVVITDPEATIVADVAGVDAGYTLVGTTAVDPIGDDVFANSTSGNYAGLLSTATIDQTGEYYTFDIRGEGQIGFGLVHTQESFDAGLYSGSAVYADPTTFAVNNSAHYGFQFSHWFHPTPNGSWTNYGANTGYSQRAGWSNWESQDEWLAGDPVKVRVGIDTNGFISIETLQDDDATWIVHARTSYPVPEGSVYRLGIKSSSSAPRVYSAPKVHLRAVEVTAPTSLGDQTITVFEDNVGDIAGTLAGGIQFAGTDDGNDNDGFVTTETISAVGDFFQFEWTGGLGDANVGLFSDQDHAVADLQTDRGDWSNADYIFFGARTENNGTLNEVYYEEGGHTALATSGGNGYGRIGFDADGRPTLWYSSDGVVWTAYRRMNQAAPAGTYRFIFVAQGGGDLTSLTKGTQSFAPVMTFRYIESPDGYYDFPLFATAEEANYWNTVKGGSGVSHAHVYPDDPTNTTWYMPDAYNEMSSATDLSTANTNATNFFDGNPIIWTEITSLTNTDLAPSTFTAADLTVNEGETVNYQTQPQDTAYTTTFSGLPTGLTDGNGGMIVGTAPEVTGDNVANPSDTYTITVTRTNTYGSSTGTFDIIVNNLTAPVVTPISGFTHVTGSTALVDSDTLADGSVVSLDDLVQVGHRLHIDSTFLSNQVLPRLVTSDAGNANDATVEKFFVGIPMAGADFSDGISEADFKMGVMLQRNGPSSIRYRVITEGVFRSSTGVGTSNTTLNWEIVLQNYGTELEVGHAGNTNNPENILSATNGGSWTAAYRPSSVTAADQQVVMGIVNTTMDITASGLNELENPYLSNEIRVSETSETDARFDVGNGPVTVDNITLSAGTTYKFFLNNASIESGDTLTFETADGTTYTTGVTTVGSHGDYYYYVQFAVPTDVPPLHAVWNGTDLPSINISGSTYTAPVTGITLEGSSVGQTASNLFNAGAHGWASVTETLSAGERLILDNAFLVDLVDAMPTNSLVSFGLKDTDWTNGSNFNDGFVGGARFTIVKGTGSVPVQCYSYKSHNGITTQSTIHSMTVAQVASQNLEAFLELTSTGNNIRSGYRRDYLSTSAEGVTTTPYGDWPTTRKTQTGDQGFGLTAVDIMIQARSTDSSSGPMLSTDVDWTGLSEINIPQPAPTLLTSWTKALDFSGSSEHLAQVSTHTNTSPMKMGSSANIVPAPTTSGNTSASSLARPWATSIVFKSDFNSSNQHIWNLGEGAGSTDDNIYLRTDANGLLYFGWGRQGALNECRLGGQAITGWRAVYIAHNGTRLSGNDATPANLAACFDIRVVNPTNNWDMTYVYNVSTAANWITSGGRMDRQIEGRFTVGGRGNNRNFHGKVASVVSTTLLVDDAMPDNTEIQMMITDPTQWLADYKDGENYRRCEYQYTYTAFRGDLFAGYASCQVWLMGDGTNDSYANMVRNQAAPNETNYTRLQLNSMVSNDFETVTIPGLS